MKIITEDGFKYTKKNLKMEGMVICRTNVKNLLIARKYVKRRESEQNLKFRNKVIITKIIWKMISEGFKDDCCEYVKLLKRYARKNREKIRFYNKYIIFCLIIEYYFQSYKPDFENIATIEEFFKKNNKMSLKDFVKKGILRRVYGYEMIKEKVL
jgi:hypothetical protein